MSVEADCVNCHKHHSWSSLKRCIIDVDFGVKCLNCDDILITNLNIVIGCLQSLPFVTYIHENQIFLIIKDLRMHINELYKSRLEDDEVETFNLMLFREIRGQLFWNSIFHMIENDLPYDFVLPYEDVSMVQNYKYVNRHVPIYPIDEMEGIQLQKKSRRHKSEIPMI
jgi:hypothetical protein